MTNGRLRHGFHAAGEHHVRFAQLDHLRRIDDGLHARSAQPVHGERRRLDRQSRAQGHMPGAIEGVTRSLLRVAEDGVVEFLGIKSGALDGAFAGDGAQFLAVKSFSLPQ